jgi:hypothetical protein
VSSRMQEEKGRRETNRSVHLETTLQCKVLNRRHPHGGKTPRDFVDVFEFEVTEVWGVELEEVEDGTELIRSESPPRSFLWSRESGTIESKVL